MNLWVINHYAYRPGEPASLRHYTLARELIGKGHCVRVFASSFCHKTKQQRAEADAKLSDELVGNVPFTWIRSPGYRGNSLKRLWNMIVFAFRAGRLPRKYFEAPPEVVIGSSPDLFAALAAERLARRLGVPFVLEVRDLWPDVIAELGGYRRTSPPIRLLEALEKYLYRNAALILCTAPATRDRLAEKGADPDRIHWLPNGVDLSVAPAPAPPAERQKPVLMYAGAHSSYGALDTLLDAARLLKEENYTGVDIVMIGDGIEKPRLLERARREALDIEFLDQVPNDTVFALLQTADFFVTLLKDSKFNESGISPFKIFDYMASARPVILAARTPWDPVAEGKAGLTVAPEDPVALAAAIKQMAGMSKTVRWELGLNGRRFVEEGHSLDKIAGKLERLIQDLLQVSPRGHDG